LSIPVTIKNVQQGVDIHLVCQSKKMTNNPFFKKTKNKKS